MLGNRTLTGSLSVRIAKAVTVVTILALATAFAQNGRVLRVGVGDLPPMLDPQGSVSITGSRIYYNVFETLIRMDPLDSTVLLPGLAESWRRLADNALELTLKAGVTFHNGEAFTSADVKFSLERVLGDDPLLANARGLLNVIDHVDTPDPLTAVVYTTEPDPVLEQRLASLWGPWMLPEDYITENGDEHFQRSPVGTGPFKVVLFQPDVVELEAYDGYWGASPNVDRVTYRVIPEASSRVTALVNREVDLINPVLPDQIDLLRGFDNVTVQCTPHELIHLLTYNTANPVMANKLLRQAINLGIDRNAIVEGLWEPGAASETHGFQFEDFGYMFLDDVPLTPFDPERARELVRESGYAGEVIYYDLIPGYYDNDIQAAEAIVEMLADIGINVQIRATTKFWQNDDRGIHPWSYAERFPDPVSGLWLLFGEYSDRQARGKNDWVDPNPRFNELGNELAVSMNPDERKEIWSEMHAIWVDDAPGTTLWQPAVCTGVSVDVDWQLYPTQTMDFGAANFRFKD